MGANPYNEEYKKIGLNALSKRAIKEDEMDKKEILDLIRSIPKSSQFNRERKKYYMRGYMCLIENQLCNAKQRVFYYQDIKEIKSKLERTISLYKDLDLITIIRYDKDKAKNNNSLTDKHKVTTIGLNIINKILAYIDKNDFLYDDLKNPITEAVEVPAIPTERGKFTPFSINSYLRNTKNTMDAIRNRGELDEYVQTRKNSLKNLSKTKKFKANVKMAIETINAAYKNHPLVTNKNLLFFSNEAAARAKTAGPASAKRGFFSRLFTRKKTNSSRLKPEAPSLLNDLGM